MRKKVQCRQRSATSARRLTGDSLHGGRIVLVMQVCGTKGFAHYIDIPTQGRLSGLQTKRHTCPIYYRGFIAPVKARTLYHDVSRLRIRLQVRYVVFLLVLTSFSRKQSTAPRAHTQLPSYDGCSLCVIARSLQPDYACDGLFHNTPHGMVPTDMPLQEDTKRPALLTC